VKLQSVAGAYWCAGSTRPMLTRDSGTAFFKKKDLDEHLERLEQARARDHRRLGPQLGLFTFSEISPGAAFWLPKGTTLFNSLVALNRRMQLERGYVEVKTPQLYESELYVTSGHWGKYKDNLFISEYEDREFALKPMNCPGHCHLFGMQRWSYRDLPYRCAEPGLLHRREPSGTLHGLLRVRHFCQDDARSTDIHVRHSQQTKHLSAARRTLVISGVPARPCNERPRSRFGACHCFGHACDGVRFHWQGVCHQDRRNMGSS